MNRFEIGALIAVTLVALMYGGDTAFAWKFYSTSRHLSVADQAWLAAAWMLATLGPIAIALLFWRLSKRVRWPWLLHLLFLPIAVLALEAGSSIMLDLMQQPDFDAMLGIPIMPATWLILVAVGGYGVSLGAVLLSKPTAAAEAVPQLEP